MNKLGKGMAAIGPWAFLAGLIISAIIAIVSGTNPQTWAIVVIGVLSIIVGLLNVSDKETAPYLMASIAFILSASSLANVLGIVLPIAAVPAFFNLMVVFFAPGAAIVAIKSLFSITKN